jgi:protein translocase SecG subunit
MDEKIAKYLKTYGVLAAFLVLIVLLGELRFTGLLTGLITLIAFVLVAAVLIQQGKGGGLVGALGGMSGDTMFGTTATPVKKFTAALGILFVVGVLCLGRAMRETGGARPAPAPSAPAREAPVPSVPAPIKVPASPSPKAK